LGRATTETSIVDPDSKGPQIRIRIEIPIQEGKMTNKNGKKLINFKCWIFSLGAEGFSCSLDVV
jgi:hypothetical protein